MFGNRYVNYGGPGGVRRGLIWQNSEVGDPCEVSKEWDEWTNPGYFDIELAIKLAYQSLTYEPYKDDVEADTHGEMTEAYFNSLKEQSLNECLTQVRAHLDTLMYDGVGLALVHFMWTRPLFTWSYQFPWSVIVFKNKEIKGYYSTLFGSKVNNEYWKSYPIEIKGDDTLEHRYMNQYVYRQYLPGYAPYVWGDNYSDDSADGGPNHYIGNYLTGYRGQNRLAQIRYETQIPNCVVSPCATSHWLGNNVDIHH